MSRRLRGSVSVLIGVSLAIATQHSDSGISGWEELGIVVAGTLIAAMLIGAAGFTWDRYRRPHILVECGIGERFQQRKTPEERHRMPGRDTRITGAYVTRLRVRETKNIPAPSVRIRIVATYPVPRDHGILPATLAWVSGEISQDLPPRDRAYVRLCEWIEYDHGTEPGRVDSHVPGLDRGATVEFQVEPIVAGKRGKRKWFVCEWPQAAEWPTVRDARA